MIIIHLNRYPHRHLKPPGLVPKPTPKPTPVPSPTPKPTPWTSGCQFSRYGCCQDGKTFRQFGGWHYNCSRRQYACGDFLYGCCQDGVTKRQGFDDKTTCANLPVEGVRNEVVDDVIGYIYDDSSNYFSLQ